MPRYAFKLRIKSDAIEEYEREHQRVWPELLAKLKEVGISDYSINQRWQVFMSRLFEPVPGKLEGERFAMLKEVFYLE